MGTTFFTESELREMTFQTLAEKYFMACAKKDDERAHKIAYYDMAR